MTIAPTPRPSLPQGEAATGPPEQRGLARDEVRLLVARHASLHHDVFRNLPSHLTAGDVVVVNTSATRPAAIRARWEDREVDLHLSARLDDGDWAVEVRRLDRTGPVLDAREGDRLQLSGGGVAVLTAPFIGGGSRLWRARVSTPDRLDRHMESHGRPISYGYGEPSWPLSAYQTIFARPDDPTGSSAEMPSAARPFTHEMVTALVRDRITVVPITLHAGVSSLERHESPPPERFVVSPSTAEAVTAARRRGSRVVAVGTTVTRALETVATPDGAVEPGDGWTDLILDADRPARIVEGLVTGWHPPEASHLRLLEAVADPDLLEAAYRAAHERGYLWHEFGDSCLLLP